MVWKISLFLFIKTCTKFIKKGSQNIFRILIFLIDFVYRLLPKLYENLQGRIFDAKWQIDHFVADKLHADIIRIARLEFKISIFSIVGSTQGLQRSNFNFNSIKFLIFSILCKSLLFKQNNFAKFAENEKKKMENLVNIKNRKCFFLVTWQPCLHHFFLFGRSSKHICL